MMALRLGRVFLVAGATAFALPGFAMASGTWHVLHQEVLLPGVVLDGHETHATRLLIDGSVDSVLADESRRWRSRPAPIQRVDEGGWSRIVQVDGDWIESLELRATSRHGVIEGRRMRTRLARTDTSAELLARAFCLDLLPDGMQVLRQLANVEGARRVDTCIARGRRDPEVVRTAIAAVLTRHGFSRIEQQDTQPVVRHRAAAQGRAMVFSRMTEELVVTVAPEGDGTAVVTHWSH